MGPRRSSDPWAPRVRAAFRDARRRLVALCTALVLVAVSLTAGKAYLWCVPLQQAMHECCCAAEHEATGSEQPAVRRACCDVQTVGLLPAVSVPPAATGVPPALVSGFAILPAPLEPARAIAQPPASHLPRSLRYGLTRAGPSFASDNCVRLQILRC